ncbi:pyruvate:ferredoxin (flavodoxin) oxidoreductase [Chloroflexia bacterium SDU3-3]|nr:pyruvate:ferredoxin (flavodoxin) oxidoreductase [Chloroflexia bacterium SDU3-3]
MQRPRETIDGNEAAAGVAHKLSEVIAIYPITPSTPMGEHADAWTAVGKKNIWGGVPQVVEMQSEGGAAGAIHGALLSGALATTFTASQGLLLMIPNMYKIAGELTPAVFHVAARALATHALSIFGDHSDVMATRQAGWAMLCSHNVQESQDLALISHAATLEARVPFMHFFDGFRTSHELNTIERLTDDDLRAMIDDKLVLAHRARGLTPESPVIHGTAQNPDVFFQSREAANTYYLACAGIVQRTMDKFAQLTGRQYHLFDYAGDPEAERVIVVMGSGAETVEVTVEALRAKGERVGVLKVHLFRPFDISAFVDALPATVRSIAVLDRTKEPGAIGEPLYQDVLTALIERGKEGIRVIGGRYGLGSKEFTPAMAKAAFDELKSETPRRHFTVGIQDDVTKLSLDYDPSFTIEAPGATSCVFWGIGSDGTVGANKSAISIIGRDTGYYAQAYFVYDSKKSGSVTTSHLRFGPQPIRAPYIVDQANFVACSQFTILERLDILSGVADGATLLLNSPFDAAEVWNNLPTDMRRQIVAKHLRLFVIDAAAVAKKAGLGGRVNTVMQTAFFALSGVMPREQAIASFKQSIRKSYGKRGEEVVQKNFAAVDTAIAHLAEVDVEDMVARTQTELYRRAPVPAEAPAFVRDVLGPMIAFEGEKLPVSMLPADGTYPTATTKWEKRNLASEIPVWNADACIQCGKCVFVCPHAAIRATAYAPDQLVGAPETFKSMPARFKELPGDLYTLQVAPEDCTGCSLCVEICPAKDKQQPGRKALNMEPQAPLREQEVANWTFFSNLPETDRTKLNTNVLKNTQLLIPLFEFSGACSGCGETPYLRLLTQLYGDRLYVANATGCSSIYGGNLPTTPWATNSKGRGPAWSNSLFEDNAEFGLGMRMTIDAQNLRARTMVDQFRAQIGDELADGLLNAPQGTEAEISAQRARIDALKQAAPSIPGAEDLASLGDYLLRKSVWIIGGDGWAYDIGYGGLDHVLASGRNVKVLVMDTEVYSNTGGQASKSTPSGAVAKFAAKGKATAKKDLGLLAMEYGNVYVAQIAMGADDQQTLKAFQEAEAYDGPALIIAYAHCIAHGIDMRMGLSQQKLAVQSGHWPLFRFNPDLEAKSMSLDSKAASVPLEDYLYNETRYRQLRDSDPERAAMLLEYAKAAGVARRRRLERIAQDA